MTWSFINLIACGDYGAGALELIERSHTASSRQPVPLEEELFSAAQPSPLRSNVSIHLPHPEGLGEDT